MAAQSFPAAPANAEPTVVRGPQSNFMVPRIGDVIDDLPEAAKAKLIDLRQRAEDAGSLARAVMEAREEQRFSRMEIQARIKQLMQARSTGGYSLQADAPQVIAEQKKLDKVEAEFKRIDELSDVRHSQRGNLRRIVDGIEQWLRGGRPGGVALALYAGAAPQLKKGESVTDAIEGRRRSTWAALPKTASLVWRLTVATIWMPAASLI